MGNSTTEHDLMTATDIMPIEVWDLLLTKLEAPEDLYAAHNSCYTFRQLLSKKRSTFLFTYVFPILMDNNLASDYQNDQTKKFDKQVLWLRSVCKSWRSGLDAHFKSIEYYRRSRSQELLRFDPFVFQSVQDVESFLDKMATHAGNPFFNGHVKISDLFLDWFEYEPFLFWELLSTSFLPRFGKHILYCEIYSTTINEDDSYGYPSLATVLSEMPALCLLYLNCNIYEHRSFSELPRPALPDFDNIKVLHARNNGIDVTNKLLRAASNCQLQTLILELDDGEEATRFNSSGWDLIFQLPSLKETTLPDISSSEALNKLCKASWSIAYLCISVNLVDENLGARLKNVAEDHQISLSHLFNAFSSEGDKSTIRRLQLNLKGPAEIGIDLRLKLPLLEQLEMHSDDGRISVNSLDFAVEMKSLNSLSIVVRDNCFTKKTNRKELINFSGMVTDMKRSNIWTVLPNLGKLSLCNLHFATSTEYKYSR